MTGWTAKRSWADSSPIAGKHHDPSKQYHHLTCAERVRVIVSRKASQIDLPLPQDPTPTASELGAPSTSAASSDVESANTTITKCMGRSQAEKDRRNRAKIRRQNALDPGVELGVLNLISVIVSHILIHFQPHALSGSSPRRQQLTRDTNIPSLTTVQPHRNIIFSFAKHEPFPLLVPVY